MMKLHLQKILEIEENLQDSFYLLDLNEFENNFLEFENSCKKHYSKIQIAYSYKTNYTPKLCQIVHKHNGFAEVVSELEYQMAQQLNVPNKNIVVNGPLHSYDFVETVLLNNSIFNMDSWYLLDYVEKICIKYPEKQFNIGIRVNFNIADGKFSRFGFEYSDKNFNRILKTINSLSNCRINALHCHFSTGSRSLASYKTRAEGLINIYDTYFKNAPLEYINIGGGFFSKMPDSLKSQFNAAIPSYQEYADAFVPVIADYFSNKNHIPILLIEPGTAITANTMTFVSKVIDIKQIGNKKIALVNASVHNVKPTLNNKNLPIKIISSNNDTTNNVEEYDIVGYTCMETDYVNKNYKGLLMVGDYVLFENVGAYTSVFKPPFIKAQSPIVSFYNDKYEIAKRKETIKDIIMTYNY